VKDKDYFREFLDSGLFGLQLLFFGHRSYVLVFLCEEHASQKNLYGLLQVGKDRPKWPLLKFQ
jgi:hypothetical protein